MYPMSIDDLLCTHETGCVILQQIAQLTDFLRHCQLDNGERFMYDSGVPLFIAFPFSVEGTFSVNFTDGRESILGEAHARP
jgi:hypothetical protein